MVACPVERLKSPLTPLTVLTSWLGGALGASVALMVAALGQGIGATLGGCSWIGVSLPIHRQVWSLVNEPNLAFAASTSATGYWLGSVALPLIVAATAVPLLPRRRTHGLELTVIQAAWMHAVLGLAWLPLLDAEDGHVVRWLALHDLPSALIWLLPLLSALLVVPPALHLLSLARAARTNLGRSARLAVVVIHLMPPLAAWVLLSASLRGDPPVLAAAALGLPVLAVLVTAWVGFPAPYVHDLRPLSLATVAGLAASLALAGCIVWAFGRPLDDGRVAGFQWGRAGPFDNVRPWIDPIELGSRPSR
jgi:hypothetical protein